jgi:dihydrofolate synthase/folylpolyglutamate synthase
MGGRWDATSIADPAVAVVTGVGLDHTERLGSTIEAIARDKAHIIKRGSSVVLGPGTLPVASLFLERAESFDLHARFVAEAGEPSPAPPERTVRFEVRARPDRPGGVLRLDVRGIHAEYRDLAVTAPSYQAQNVAVATAAAECALGRGLHEDAVRRALAAMSFPGRFELVASDPPVVLDGAHNPQAAEVLAGAIAEAWPDPAARPLCVIGVLADKDAEGIARALAPVVSGFVATEPDSPRALPAGDLARTVEGAGGRVVAVEPDVARAVATARAEGGGAAVVVTGSLYTAGSARGLTYS